MGIIPRIWKPSFEPRTVMRWFEQLGVDEVVAAPLYAIDPFGTQFGDVECAQYYRAGRVQPVEPVEQALSVMTWNIKFGGGRIDFWFDGHGDRVLMRRGEVLANLEGVAAKIRHVDPDVLLVQEVDVESKRVAHVDQMQWLLDHTDLNYGAYASQWRSRFIPAEGLGNVDMGIAVLSKYPVHDARRLALPTMDSQDGVTRYFYLHRAILTARIDIGPGPDLHVVNTHAEAFSTDGTKQRQLDLFKAELDRIDRAGGRFVAGGDLNTLPPGTKQWHDFEDVVGGSDEFEASDYRQETRWLEPLYEAYEPAVARSDYREDNEPHFTHSTTREVFWSRKLDYLFTNAGFVAGSSMTHQDASSGGMETMPLSDHAPVTAQLAIPHV